MKICNRFTRQTAFPETRPHPLPLGVTRALHLGCRSLQQLSVPWEWPLLPLQVSRPGCPTRPFCLALSASPTRSLSLGAITCDFLVPDAVRFPGPGGTGGWGFPSLPPHLVWLSSYSCLPTAKWSLKQHAAFVVQLQHF